MLEKEAPWKEISTDKVSGQTGRQILGMVRSCLKGKSSDAIIGAKQSIHPPLPGALQGTVKMD